MRAKSLRKFLLAEMQADDTVAMDEVEWLLYRNEQRLGGYILYRSPLQPKGVLALETLNSDELNARWNELLLEVERKAPNE